MPSIQDVVVRGDDHESTVAEMFDELLAWSSALRALRASGVTQPADRCSGLYQGVRRTSHPSAEASYWGSCRTRERFSTRGLRRLAATVDEFLESHS
jgi:hypothetical protein